MNPLPQVGPNDRGWSPVGWWNYPALIQPNSFIHKSLSNWSFNIAIGCAHACRFCYVPGASTIKQASKLREYGVNDPDAEWGDYVLLRNWDEKRFLTTLSAAERTPIGELSPDGNRAVIYCSTTDAYQVFRHPDPEINRKLASEAKHIVRRSLELIRDHSTLNVRILTRSPLARRDFDLFASFGHRLLFGMSVPTLRNDLAKIYEPRAPAPSQRLATLKAAKDAGLHIYVAVAPTYPECNENDLRETLNAVAELDPVTIFHEPINIRAENVARIAEQAQKLRIRLHTEVFDTRRTWKEYALSSLKTVQLLAKELGVSRKLHLWPDKVLGSAWIVHSMPRPRQYEQWLERWWTRISEWPEKPAKQNSRTLSSPAAVDC